MARFSGTQVTRRPVGPVRTVGIAPTHEGGVGYSRDAKGELFITTLSSLLTDTFYESADDRIARLQKLVREVVRTDPDWVRRFIPYVRDTLNLRSVSILLAAEYAAAGGPGARAVVTSAMSRADEPAEMLGYWLKYHGRKLPQPVKRGIADGAVKLYDEYALLKYDGQSRDIRFADVIQLTHPKPKSHDQAALFKVALNRRYKNDDLSRVGLTSKLAFDRDLLQLAPEHRRTILRSNPEVLSAAGWTWERLSGWLPGGMDAEAWEAVIPSMGYMALLRNLRNFDEAGVSRKVKDEVARIIADPERVAKSRQFPYRFYSAYTATQSDFWKQPLSDALDASTQNVPTLKGRTLVLVDSSGSMQGGWGKSKISPADQAALFGVSLAVKGEDVTYVEWADRSAVRNVNKHGSVLAQVERLRQFNGRVGYGTRIAPAISAHYTPGKFDRVIIVSDMQVWDAAKCDDQAFWYLFNIGGYKTTALNLNRPGVLELGGFSDATFKLMDQFEQYRNQGWPF